jgi:periplasmic divalent cation tolerance protein
VSELRVVLSTAPDADQAAALAETLVAEQLVACAQIIPIAASVYRWQGRVVREPEHLLIMKTTLARVPELQARLVALHPYEVPQFVALSADAVWPPYLAWVVGEVTEH